MQQLFSECNAWYMSDSIVARYISLSTASNIYLIAEVIQRTTVDEITAKALSVKPASEVRNMDTTMLHSRSEGGH
jgi:hypothetical protein